MLCGCRGPVSKSDVLCGHRGSSSELRGCINDAHCLRHLLTSRFNFRDSDIVMLTDDSPNPQAWPTRANMLYQMQLLTWNAQPGDSLVFHFSGMVQFNVPPSNCCRTLFCNFLLMGSKK